MSLLIKGMNMPKSCSDCAMRYMAIGYDWECVFTNDDVRDYDKKRLSNCPLTEITSPHGRLVDADALLSRLNGIKYAANVEDWISRKPIFADGLEEEIISAPTIIEAEG